MFDEMYLETNDECIGYWIFDDKQSDVDSILNCAEVDNAQLD